MEASVLKHTFKVPIKNMSVFTLCVSGFGDRFFELTTDITADMSIEAELKTLDKIEGQDFGFGIVMASDSPKMFYPIDSNAVDFNTKTALDAELKAAVFNYVSDFDNEEVNNLDSTLIFNMDKTDK